MTDEMMKACHYDKFGLKNVKVSSIKKPRSPNKDELLIRVHAASLNPADWQQIEGESSAILKFEWPRIVGFDFSGTVEETHSSEDSFAQGDEVFGMISGLPEFMKGTLAEFVLVPSKVVVKKPKNVAHTEAAALPLVCITAIKMFRECGIKEDKDYSQSEGPSVFITGGAGGVGSVCIQLAKKLYGAKNIVTTASEGKKTEVCKSLGADHVINYRTVDFEKPLNESGTKFDVILDCMGDAKRCVSLLKCGGGMCSIVTGPSAESLRTWLKESLWPTSKITLGVYSYLHGFLSSTFDIFSGVSSIKNACTAKGATFGHILGTGNAEIMSIVATLMDKGLLKAVIDKTFRLDEAVDAIEYQKLGRCAGKVVIEIIHE